jgi:hypothetical protein
MEAGAGFQGNRSIFNSVFAQRYQPAEFLVLIRQLSECFAAIRAGPIPV